MPDLILYLLKANTALLLFYLAYYFVLRRLTFYHLNRLFLVFGILFSSVYPFVDLSNIFTQHQELAYAYIPPVTVWVTTADVPAAVPSFDYWQIPVLLFWAGVVVTFFRLLLQFVSLYKLHAVSVPAAHKGIGFRQVKSITHAFSFWQTIYLNPERHKVGELEAILQHEQIHVKGWHTLDVLLAELSTVFYWFNPGVWLMKKAIKENLEFIADQHVVSAGVDKKEYQYLLLKVTATPEPQIANQFNFPSLKRRIAMMNKIPTKKANQLRLLVVLPIVAALLFTFRGAAQTQSSAAKQEPTIKRVVTEEKIDKSKEYTEVAPNVYMKNNLDLEYVRWTRPNTIVIKPKSGEEETYQLDDKKSLAEANRKYGVQVTPPDENKSPSGNSLQEPTQDDPNLPEDYRAFLNRNPAVKYVGWQLSDTKEGVNTVTVYLKSGGSETYNLNDKSSISSAENKYGALPNLPPPPPPYKNDIPVYFPEASDLQEDHKAFLKRNPEVKQLGWMIGDSFGRQVRMLVLKLQSGGSEIYDLEYGYGVASAEMKYGELPALPPPPPPVRREN